jgi:hypothetical protein
VTSFWQSQAIVGGTDIIVGGGTTQIFSDQVSDTSSNQEKPVVGRFSLDGALIWLKVI